MIKSNKISNIPYSALGDKTQDEIILQPFTYILQVPGKQIRSKLIYAFNTWLKISDDKLYEITKIIPILHNSSVLIDDIEDGSVLRRGIPVAHAIYGIPNTINAAYYVTFIAQEKILNLGNPDSIKVYIKQILEIHRGQGMEMYWRDNFICPSEAEYKLMTTRKTGGLFMLVIALMQLFSENKTDFSKLVNTLGLYFQIRDDYCNLYSQEYSENKNYCEDLTEGKFSFPIIHAINSNPDDGQVMHILRQRTTNIEVKKYFVSLLEKYGSFKYTVEILKDLDKQIRKEVQRLGGNSKMELILEELLTWNEN